MQPRGCVALAPAFLYGNHALLSPDSTAMQGVPRLGQSRVRLMTEGLRRRCGPVLLVMKGEATI
jgi:hypothetical protein